jgi:hypothetical protein
MRQLLKSALLCIGICSSVISCDTMPEPEVNSIDVLTSNVLKSSSFKALGVAPNDLNIQSSQFTTSEKEAIYIPYAGESLGKGIVALFDKNSYKIQTVVQFEIKMDGDLNKFKESMENGTFNGEMTFINSNYNVQFELKNSKMLKKSISKQSRASACGPMSQPGGALDCAGARLEQMNWLDSAAVYLSGFMPWLVQEVASCLLDGCVV